MAFDGQASAQAPQRVHRSRSVTIPSEVSVMAFSAQASAQVPHRMHLAGENIFSVKGDIPSGL